MFALDFDGVIIGKKPGVNYPQPSRTVINALKEIRADGNIVCLCISRPLFATLDIIREANLDSFRIAEGGALIASPFTREQIRCQSISASLG